MAPVSENNQNNKIKALRLWWKWKPVMKRDWQRSHYILAWILKCPQKKNIKNTDLYYDTVTVKPKTRSENCTDFQEWQIRTGIHTHARTHTHTTPPHPLEFPQIFIGLIYFFWFLTGPLQFIGTIPLWYVPFYPSLRSLSSTLLPCSFLPCLLHLEIIYL